MDVASEFRGGDSGAPTGHACAPRHLSGREEGSPASVPGHSWLLNSGSCSREGEVARGCGLRPRLCLRVG